MTAHEFIQEISEKGFLVLPSDFKRRRAIHVLKCRVAKNRPDIRVGFSRSANAYIKLDKGIVCINRELYRWDIERKEYYPVSKTTAMGLGLYPKQPTPRRNNSEYEAKMLDPRPSLPTRIKRLLGYGR